MRTSPSSSAPRHTSAPPAAQKAEKKLELAVSYWQKIVGNSALPEADREYAQRELDDYKRAHPSPSADEDEVAKRRTAMMAERRKKAIRLVESAKLLRDRGDFEQALAKAYEARAIDPTYDPAREELARILAERPDRATMLESLMRLLQTQELAERRDLMRTVRSLRERGKAAGDVDDFETADRLLRDAIARIDESGFLETSGRRYTITLDELRQELVSWLRQVHERAAKADKTFPGIPDAPDFRERTAGLQGQLFALLSQLFRPNDARESVHFYRIRLRSSKQPAALAQLAVSGHAGEPDPLEAVARTLGRELHP